MKAFTFITILLFFYIIGRGTNNEKTKLLGEEFNGRVKSLSQKVYNVKEMFGEITKDSSKAYSGIELNYYVTFNSDGNPIEMEIYDSEYNYSKFRIKFEYDNSGNQTSVKSSKPNGSLAGKQVKEYDSSHNVLLIENYNGDGKLKGKETFKYDRQNNRIEENTYSSDSNLSHRTTFKYDSRNNKIERNTYMPDGDLSYKKTFKYDNNNNLVEENEYLPDGSLYHSWIYKYDSYNNLIKKNSYDADGNQKLIINCKYDKEGNRVEIEEEELNNSTLRTTFKYDGRNNWIKRIHFKNDTAKYITERKFVYYD